MSQLFACKGREFVLQQIDTDVTNVLQKSGVWDSLWREMRIFAGREMGSERGRTPQELKGVKEVIASLRE